MDLSAAAVNANLAFTAGTTGRGVTVAVIDSGIANHPDVKSGGLLLGLLPRVIYQESFVPGDPRTDDEFGHGTHVAGILAGNGKESTGNGFTKTYRGIAPEARLMNLRVLDRNGKGTDSAVINAIHRAILLKTLLNIKVINLSLGRPVWESYTKDPLCRAVEAAWKAGITVVVSAGNEGRNNSAGTNGYGTISSPGNSPYAITVGAMRTMQSMSRGDDLIASYSSKGPTRIDHIVKPDLVAPGNQVASLMTSGTLAAQAAANNTLVPLSYYQRNAAGYLFSQDYYKLSGTSMAAPVVSGAVALLLDREPSLTPDQLKARLMRTASKSFPTQSTVLRPGNQLNFRQPIRHVQRRRRYLDIWAALNNRENVRGTARSPRAVVDAATGKVRIVRTEANSWSDSGSYGPSAVWGDSVFVGGSSAVWGDWPSGGIPQFGATIQPTDIAPFGAIQPSVVSAFWGRFRIVGTQPSSQRRKVIR